MVASLLLTVALANVPAAPGSAQDVVPAPMQGIDVVEHLGETVPRDLSFVDSEGRAVKLSDYFDGEHPVVLTLAYYRCPMLCNLVLKGTSKTLLETQFQLKDDYRAVTISIDPKEGPKQAGEAKRGHVGKMVKHPGQESGWAFLTSPDESQVRKLADAVGFKYAYDKETTQFAHAAVVFVLTPEGKISRYFYGMEFSPRDLRLSLVEAAAGKVGTTFDKVMLTCFKFDPATRKYAFYLNALLRGGALTVFLGIAAMLGVLWRREIRKGTVS